MAISTPSKRLFLALSICLLLILPLPWTIYRSPQTKPRTPNQKSQIQALNPPPHPNDPIVQSLPNRISHPDADAYYPHLSPNTEWYMGNWLPNFYAAWEHNPFVRVSPLPIHRAEISKYGARVACWPSSGGGVWIKAADLVELDYLGLSRQDDTPRGYDQSAEDRFCAKLRGLGGEWWSLPPDFEYRRGFGWNNYAYEQFNCETLEECFEPQVRTGYVVAWPEADEVVCYVLKKEARRWSWKEWNRYYNAADMNERCSVILEMGGKWCRGKGACSELMELVWGAHDPGPLRCPVH